MLLAPVPCKVQAPRRQQWCPWESHPLSILAVALTPAELASESHIPGVLEVQGVNLRVSTYPRNRCGAVLLVWNILEGTSCCSQPTVEILFHEQSFCTKTRVIADTCSRQFCECLMLRPYKMLLAFKGKGIQTHTTSL